MRFMNVVFPTLQSPQRTILNFRVVGTGGSVVVVVIFDLQKFLKCRRRRRQYPRSATNVDVLFEVSKTTLKDKIMEDGAFVKMFGSLLAGLTTELIKKLDVCQDFVNTVIPNHEDQSSTNVLRTLIKTLVVKNIANLPLNKQK